MRSFFKKQTYESATPETTRYQSPPRISSPSSSLTNPPSSFIDLTSKPSNGPDSEPKPPSFHNEADKPSIPNPLQPSSESFPCADEAPPSSLNASSQSSNRIIKGGKEVVISSDGEESDSDCSLGEDPSALFARMFKRQGKTLAPKVVVPPPKPTTTTTKKYKNTIDSLVHGAWDDNETDANVARVKASFAKVQHAGAREGNGQGTPRPKDSLHEEILTSALGEGNEEEGGGIRRLLDAVRRTEALDQDKTWRFLDQTQTTPIMVEFPRHLFPPTSNLAALREPEPRDRLFKSGILEFAASVSSQSQILPDEFLLWLFHSVPLEPQEELRQAYCRVIAHSTRIKSIIRPSDIDDLFKQVGASSEALDISNPIKEESSDKTHKEPSLKNRGSLLSTFNLLRDAAQLLDNDTRDRAIHTLLRMTLDDSLTNDDMIRSELQSCLSSLLETVPDEHIEEMERRICTTVYDTFQDVQFQSRMLQHILPTAPWISLLRYRLAMAFLLRCPDPLAESAQEVLDFDRLSLFLIRDERLKVKSFNRNSDYAYGELTAIALLLDMVLNTSLYDLEYRQTNKETEFNAAIDRIAAQIKRIFSSIEDSGAAHLKRMLAKQALEAVHYRMVYSVRSKPPPPKLPYEESAKKDGNIGKWFKKQTPDSIQADGIPSTDKEGTAIPIRKHGSP